LKFGDAPPDLRPDEEARTIIMHPHKVGVSRGLQLGSFAELTLHGVCRASYIEIGQHHPSCRMVAAVS
jgi:hypothetical protein